MHGAQADQRRAPALRPSRRDRRLDRLEVVAVRRCASACQPYASKRASTSSRENARSVAAVDRDLVVVVEVDEAAEAEVAGERRRLGGDALHQVAVGADPEDVVVDTASRAEALAQEPLGERHPDAVPEALPERAGRRLDAGRVAVLGVARRLAAQLAEALELVEGQVVARTGAGSRRAASTRARPRARSGRGRATPGRPGCAA